MSLITQPSLSSPLLFSAKLMWLLKIVLIISVFPCSKLERKSIWEQLHHLIHKCDLHIWTIAWYVLIAPAKFVESVTAWTELWRELRLLLRWSGGGHMEQQMKLKLQGVSFFWVGYWVWTQGLTQGLYHLSHSASPPGSFNCSSSFQDTERGPSLQSVPTVKYFYTIQIFL
jgi:hypothetical protein